jgi:hypothetical protein
LPPALDAIFKTLDYEENGDVALLAFRAGGPGCEVDLAVDTGVDGEGDQHWRFCFEDCFDYRLSAVRSYEAGLNLHRAPHALLARWTEPHANLWFSGTAAEPARVAEALRQRHAELSGGIPGLPQHLNGELPLAGLLALRVGLLAHGPASLLREYAAVLREHALEPSLREYAPNHVDGRSGYDPSRVRALAWGESYVVGIGVHAERIGTPAPEGGTEGDASRSMSV